MEAIGTVRIHGNVDWRYQIDSLSHRWIGVCDALNIATEGESWSDLCAMIEETMNLLSTELAAPR